MSHPEPVVVDGEGRRHEGVDAVIKRVALGEPAVALALVTTAGDQMRSLVSLADDLSLKTATARVAKLLWERARVAGGPDRKAIRLQRSELDLGKGKMLPAGSIFEMPATIHHFGWTTEETIIQGHGIGPLSVNYLKPGHDVPHR